MILSPGSREHRLGERAPAVGVAHDRVRDDAPHAVGLHLACTLGVRAVDDEHVDEPLVARCDAAWLRASCQALEHPVGGPFRARPPTIGLTATLGTLRRSSAALMSATARIGQIEMNGLPGAITITSAASIASSTPGAGVAVASPSKHSVDLVAVLTRDEPLLEGKRAGRRIDPRPERIVGGGQQRHRDAKSFGQPCLGRRERLTGAQRLRTDEVETEVAVAELEPRLAA